MDDNTVNTTTENTTEVVAQAQPEAIVTPVEATLPAVPEEKKSFTEKHPKLVGAAKIAGAAAAGGLVVELIHIIKNAVTGSDDGTDITTFDLGNDAE